MASGFVDVTLGSGVALTLPWAAMVAALTTASMILSLNWLGASCP